jgi:hypothetical protein
MPEVLLLGLPTQKLLFGESKVSLVFFSVGSAIYSDMACKIAIAARTEVRKSTATMKELV